MSSYKQDGKGTICQEICSNRDCHGNKIQGRRRRTLIEVQLHFLPGRPAPSWDHPTIIIQLRAKQPDPLPQSNNNPLMQGGQWCCSPRSSSRSILLLGFIAVGDMKFPLTSSKEIQPGRGEALAPPKNTWHLWVNQSILAILMPSFFQPFSLSDYWSISGAVMPPSACQPLVQTRALLEKLDFGTESGWVDLLSPPSPSCPVHKIRLFGISLEQGR